MIYVLFSLYLLSAPNHVDLTLEDTHSRAYQIGKQLRCPVCQGMPIAESPASMAQDMMHQVRRLIAEGKSDDEIKDYFRARYGEWVLLAPPKNSSTLLLWIAPVLLTFAALFFALRSKEKKKNLTPEHTSSDSSAFNTLRKWS